MPPQVIDLRDSVVCAGCAEPLAIATYDYNGDPCALLCSECCATAATAVAGTATVAGASAPLVTA